MNVIVIVCDQLRYDAINCNGSEFVNTPNINRLASKSTVFNSAYSQAPVCAPARHCMATGQYPSKHGITQNHEFSLPGMRTIAHLLKPLGYRRFQLGNMHWRSKDLDNGFEPWVCAKLQNNSISKKAYKHALWEDTEITRRTTAGPSIRKHDEYWGYQVASTSIKQLEDAVENGESFLSWNCLIEPHPPFYPTKEIYENIDQSIMPLPIRDNPDSNPHKSISAKKEEWDHLTDIDHKRLKAGYYGMVELADKYVGMILYTVDRLNLWDNTAIIFVSDHGEQLGDHGIYSKFVMREGSLHIPFMIYHPEIKPVEVNDFVEQVDIFPTICDIVGLKKPVDIDGLSLLTLISGEYGDSSSWPRKEVFAQLGDTKMVRTRDYKLVQYDDGGVELYNIKDDPDELKNIADNTELAPVIYDLQKIIENK